jgi:hypothetical protein
MYLIALNAFRFFVVHSPHLLLTVQHLSYIYTIVDMATFGYVLSIPCLRFIPLNHCSSSSLFNTDFAMATTSVATFGSHDQLAGPVGTPELNASLASPKVLDLHYVNIKLLKHLNGHLELKSPFPSTPLIPRGHLLEVGFIDRESIPAPWAPLPDTGENWTTWLAPSSGTEKHINAKPAEPMLVRNQAVLDLADWGRKQGYFPEQRVGALNSPTLSSMAFDTTSTPPVLASPRSTSPSTTETYASSNESFNLQHKIAPPKRRRMAKFSL